MAKLIPRDGLIGPQRYLAIMVISCATILTAMDSTLVNIALPTMMVDLKVSAGSSVLIINASQIAMLVSSLLAFLPMGAGVFDVAWRMALCGIGIGLFGPPNLRQIVGATPKYRTAAVGGMVGTNRLTGQSLGAALAALVLNVAPMNANVVALGIAAALTTIGACISLARAPLQSAARQTQEMKAISESIES